MIELDPRTRLALLVLFVVVVILTPNTLALAGEVTAVALLILAGGLARAWLRVLRTLILLVLFLVAFYVWAFDWNTALAGALRLLGSVSAFFLFFQVTAPEDLGNSLVQSGVPYGLVFILITSMQFAPVLSRQARDVFDAQRARGIRLELDFASLRNFPALLAPLLIQSFTLAEQLAEAMEARGFGSPHRTFLREYRLRTLDYLTMVCGTAGAVAILWMLWRLP